MASTIERHSYKPRMWEIIRDSIGVPDYAVEVGTRFGFWSRGLLKHVGVGKRLYCIDIWPRHRSFTTYARSWVETIGDDAFVRATPLRGASVEWATVLDHKFDLVYIDGDHGTRSVIQDAETWWPKLRPGGLMIFHDLHMRSVMAGVNKFFDHTKEEFYRDVVGPKNCAGAWAIKQIKTL